MRSLGSQHSSPLFNKAIELGMADSRDAGQFLIDELRTLSKYDRRTAALITSQDECSKMADEANRTYHSARWLLITLASITVA